MTFVELELRWEPSVHDERIGVSAKGGVVELDGQVDSFYEKWAAERAALRVSNVNSFRRRNPAAAVPLHFGPDGRWGDAVSAKEVRLRTEHGT